MKGNFLGRKRRSIPFWIFQSMGLMLAASILISNSPSFGAGIGTSTCWKFENPPAAISSEFRNKHAAYVQFLWTVIISWWCWFFYLEAFWSSAVLIVLHSSHRLWSSVGSGSHGWDGQHATPREREREEMEKLVILVVCVAMLMLIWLVSWMEVSRFCSIAPANISLATTNPRCKVCLVDYQYIPFVKKILTWSI